jgi:L-ascorbate metabolism protein UlaG (beta-lactamase superfamily)
MNAEPMILRKKTLKKSILIPTYSVIMLLKTASDYFRRIQRLPSEPIVIDESEVRVWMVGHATVLINFFGTTILTDPLLVRYLPIPKRLVMHGYKAHELPDLDYVIISHAHLDHFDRRTLRMLAPKTRTLILPRACKDLVEGMPFSEIRELDWDKNYSGEDLKITSYRAEHWGKRMPWERADRGFNCYVFEKNGRAVFFGGDTAYGKHFKSIGEKHEIDIALLPISAYKPMLMTDHHMDPIEAHDAFNDLRSQHCIPIHWGSFRLALESMSEPPRLFKAKAEQNGVADRTHILPNGKSFCLADFENKILSTLNNELAVEPIKINKIP